MEQNPCKNVRGDKQMPAPRAQSSQEQTTLSITPTGLTAYQV